MAFELKIKGNNKNIFQSVNAFKESESNQMLGSSDISDQIVLITQLMSLSDHYFTDFKQFRKNTE